MTSPQHSTQQNSFTRRRKSREDAFDSPRLACERHACETSAGEAPVSEIRGEIGLALGTEPGRLGGPGVTLRSLFLRLGFHQRRERQLPESQLSQPQLPEPPLRGGPGHQKQEQASFALARQLNRSLQFKSYLFASVALSILAIAQLLSPSAFATTNITAVVNSSRAEGVNTATPTIYGGVAGSVSRGKCGTELSNDSVCDNCADAGDSGDNNLLACNNSRIHPNLRLKITVSSDAIASGRPTIATDEESSTALTLANDSPTSVAKGESATILVPWSSICAKLKETNGDPGPQDCEPVTDQLSGTLRVGISSDGGATFDGSGSEYRKVTFIVHKAIGQASASSDISLAKRCSDLSAVGICSFEVSSGDSKAVVRKLKAINGFPNSANIQFKFVRLLYETSGFSRINSASLYQDLAISGSDPANISLSPAFVTNEIYNENVYHFKTAVVDAAGNVGFYTAAADDTHCPDATVATSDCHIARPSEVVGVLANDKNCFIATAAYGSNMAPQVDVFRSFRDRFLKGHAWGQKFIQFYYQHSPSYAQTISESELLRTASRIALWPLLAFASASLQFGPLASIGLVTAIAALLFAAVRILRHGRSSRFAPQKIRSPSQRRPRA